MIEERARVDSVHGDWVTVTAGAKQGCATCAEGKGCAGGVLGKLANRKDRHVQVSNPQQLEVRPGDWVRIGLDESALVSGAMAVYLLPLLAMIAMAAMAHLGGAGEGMTTLLALAALAGGFVIAAWLQRQPGTAQRHRPVLLGAGSACSPENQLA